MTLEKAVAPSQSPGMKTRVGFDIVDIMSGWRFWKRGIL